MKRDRIETAASLLRRLAQHAPQAPGAGLLVSDGLAGKETLLPGDDVVFGMGCGGPVDTGADIPKRMPRGKGRILLIRIDQRLDFLDARRSPAFAPANGFRCASCDGAIPDIEDVIRFTLPDQTGLLVFHHVALELQDEP